MREWNLKAGDPLSLCLAADARLSSTSYTNDQIWELTLRGGEPPALALQTTFGLRARSFRLFPRFTEAEVTLSDPSHFAVPPSVRHFYPNFLEAAFSPFKDIDVLAEYWVPESQVVAGRLLLSNRSPEPRTIRVEWAAQLIPSPEGERMSSAEMGGASVLVGHTGDCFPVVFLTGGAQVGSGSFPSLHLTLELPPLSSRPLIWTEAALAEPQASFDLARETAARNLDAEKARIELLNAGQIEIHTGNPDWDAAFALAQKVAFGLFHSPTDSLPYPSFVLSRQPDQGYSLRGSGSDYNYLWVGQSPLYAYYLISLILPTDPHLAQGLLLNFLSTQNEEGFVDWRPGLAGQRSQLLATPLLATLAWKIYQACSDLGFLGEVYPKLLRFLEAWFSPQQDRDGDGFPEWSHTLHSGFEESPLFAAWLRSSQGANIATAESPSLGAFLYQECQSLMQIATALYREEEQDTLKQRAEALWAAVELAWDEDQAIYQYRDRDSHLSTQGVLLVEQAGPGEITLQQAFEQPIRLLISINGKDETTRKPVVFIHGTGPTGQHWVEQIPFEQFQWFSGSGRTTGERVYSFLERVEIQGIDPEDWVTLRSVHYQGNDYTQFLPLWAHIPDTERADALVHRTLTSPLHFWREHGLSPCPSSAPGAVEAPSQAYSPIWSSLIGEGLVAYGYIPEATALLNQMMEAVITSLKKDAAFSQHYHAETGLGQGEHNALEGLAPLGLFLSVLGVRIISRERVFIQGNNPFPWPVTVKYKGLTIFRQTGKTMVVFPGGQTINLNDPAPHLITVE